MTKSNCMIFGEKVGSSAKDAHLNFGGSRSFPTRVMEGRSIPRRCCSEVTGN